MTFLFAKNDPPPKSTRDCASDPKYVRGVVLALRARGVAAEPADVRRYLLERSEREKSWPAPEDDVPPAVQRTTDAPPRVDEDAV